VSNQKTNQFFVFLTLTLLSDFILRLCGNLYLSATLALFNYLHEPCKKAIVKMGKLVDQPGKNMYAQKVRLF